MSEISEAIEYLVELKIDGAPQDKDWVSMDENRRRRMEYAEKVERVKQEIVNEIRSLITNHIDNLNRQRACDCPALGKDNPQLHAPNCPVRNPSQTSLTNNRMGE